MQSRDHRCATSESSNGTHFNSRHGPVGRLISSREAAIVNSQGRKPLGHRPSMYGSRGAATERLPPLRGFVIGLYHVYQGLTPLAIDYRRSAAARCASDRVS